MTGLWQPTEFMYWNKNDSPVSEMKVCSKVLGKVYTSIPLQEKAIQSLVCKSNTLEFLQKINMYSLGMESTYFIIF